MGLETKDGGGSDVLGLWLPMEGEGGEGGRGRREKKNDEREGFWGLKDEGGSDVFVNANNKQVA